jgi:hypothetical protein
MKRKINFLLVLLLFGVCLVSAKQNFSVSRVVTDTSDGNPIIGVTLQVKSATNEIVFDGNGKLSLNAQQCSNHVLICILRSGNTS